MSKTVHAVSHDTGKIAFAMLFSGVLVFALMALFDGKSGGHTTSVQATTTATTTVTVLNTPPVWNVTARELFASATSTPTNSGSTTVWTATATDSNGEDYYLLICKSSSTPTPSASAAPTCGGGLSDQWAVSGPVTSGAQATTSTTTLEAWSESNDWYGYVCDGNAGSPRCTNSQYNGLHDGSVSATSSPFVVNHRPTITLAADDSPTLPGATITWTSTAGDTDSLGGDDTVQLHVCQTAGFDATIPSCTGAQWATSTFVIDNPSTSTTIAIPTQDGDLDAFVYVVDDYGHPSVGAWTGSSTVVTVSNATPYIASSTISLYDVYGSTTADFTLELTESEGETQNFVVRFDVTDENGCQNVSAGNEVTDVDINVFRSGVGGTYGLGCDTALEYDANSCYTDTVSHWVPTCSQVAASCTANDWNNITWECTFPLWYIADPTDVGSVYAAEDWRPAARATDDDAATGSYSASDAVAGTSEVLQFLSFSATGSPIAYGSWEPGQDTGIHLATTTVFATGNTGLDHYLSGDAMCVTYPTCNGYATSTIYVPYQHYATTSSGIAYTPGGGSDNFELSTSTSPDLVNVDIVKTVATSSPANDDTYWGIAVPGSITFAGDYIGRNYIDAAVAPSSEW